MDALNLSQLSSSLAASFGKCGRDAFTYISSEGGWGEDAFELHIHYPLVPGPSKGPQLVFDGIFLML